MSIEHVLKITFDRQHVNWHNVCKGEPMSDFYNWTKGTKIRFTDNFTSTEFECKCTLPSCVDQKINKRLILKLQRVREKVDKPVQVTSGYRCKEHQAHLRNTLNTAAKYSQHTTGNAADLICHPLDKLYPILETEFKAIGIAPTFFHVDLRDDKIRRFNYV